MKVLAVASAIPEAGESNAAVEDRLGLERGWIEKRTGILQRPTATATESTSDLAVRAGERVLQQASLKPEEIGLLLLATSTPDHLLPPTAPLVANRLRLRRAGAADLAGACAGFLYTLVLAAAYGASVRKPVLVIGANVLSRRVNPQDSVTAGLFSDGAGAVVLIPAEPTQFLGSYLDADGAFYDAIGVSAGGSREPMTAGALQEKRHLMSIRRGPTLFRQAVLSMAAAGKEALKSAGIDVSTVDWWIPHQANVRMTRDAGALLGVTPERTISVVEQFGNSSAATIPIALAHAVESNRIHRGQILLLTAAGAGMLSAGVVLRW